MKTKNDFNSSITAKISATEAIKRISKVPEWWGINNDVTTLNFTHAGLTPEVECYKDCAPGWTHWIKTSLFSYLTTGKGVFSEPTK
jgi:hypothetical protein